MSVEGADVISMEEDSPDDESQLSLSLLNLPVEILFHICSFLDASTLVHSLGLVCKQLYCILRDDSLWKVRITQIWPNGRYPVLPPDEDDELFWKLSCVAMEKQVSHWGDKSSMEDFTLADIHYSATVDALLLMEKGNILISGGRDRSLVCWKLEAAENDDWKYMVQPNAHDGWIWDLTAMGSTIYSCSWDKFVKSWDLGDRGLESVKEFEMDVPGALLCVSSCPGLNMIATGSFCKTVILFDPRLGRSPIATYRPHRRAVMKIAMNSNYILSASEDRTVAVWDQRARKVTNTIEISKDSYPMTMTMQKGSAYVGDNIGNLHILDSKKDFELVKSYATGHTKGIKGLHCMSGCWITGSLDTTVRLLSPTDPPQVINTLSSPHGEIAGVSLRRWITRMVYLQSQVHTFKFGEPRLEERTRARDNAD